MKPSTGFELVGFGLLAAAAWMIIPIAGVAVAGVSMLLIGYGTNDDAAIAAGKAFALSVKRRRALRTQKRAAKREARRALKAG